MTMRKRRCSSCGKRFYTKDPTITTCQDCSGDLPDRSAQEQKEAELKRRKVVDPEVPQTFPLDKLKEDSGKDQSAPITPKRKARKPKSDTGGSDT